MVATTDIIDEVREIIEERSLLKHPFYQAWQKGELTLEHLRGYAGQYYHHVLAFPQYVSAAHAICPDQGERQELLENLIEEERGDENHPELWLRFAEGVGATRADVEATAPLPRDEPARRPVPRRDDAALVRRGVRGALRVRVAGAGGGEDEDRRAQAVLRQSTTSARCSSSRCTSAPTRSTRRWARGWCGGTRRTRRRAQAVLATARECADALWGFLDGVHAAYVAA